MLLPRFFLLLIIGLFLSENSFSQNRFKHYTTEDDYAGPGVVHFAQDSLGFLWIKTGGGLYQFDGFTFTVKKANPKDPMSLPYDSGDAMFIDALGQLWTYDNNYLRLYDRDIGGFKVYTLESTIQTLSSDKKEPLIWVGTLGEGLIQFFPSSGKVLKYENEISDAGVRQNANTIMGILDRGSDLLLATNHGVWIFDKKTKTFSQPKGDKSYSDLLAKSEILALFEDRNFYWAYTPLGLFKVDAGFRIQTVFNFQEIREKFDYKKAFKNPEVNAVDRDRDGVFWISSRGLGLTRYDPAYHSLKNFRHDPTDAYSLLTDEIVGVMVDRDQNILVSEFGRGIGVLKKQAIEFYNPIPNIPANGVQFINENNKLQLIANTEFYGLMKGRIDAKISEGITFDQFKTTPELIKVNSIGECIKGKNFVWLSIFQ